MRDLSQTAMSLLLDVLDKRDRSLYLWHMLGVPKKNMRKLNRERFPNFVIKKSGSHGARHGKSEKQREYHQAKQCLRKARKIKFDSILQRFQL